MESAVIGCLPSPPRFLFLPLLSPSDLSSSSLQLAPASGFAPVRRPTAESHPPCTHGKSLRRPLPEPVARPPASTARTNRRAAGQRRPKQPRPSQHRPNRSEPGAAGPVRSRRTRTGPSPAYQGPFEPDAAEPVRTRHTQAVRYHHLPELRDLENRPVPPPETNCSSRCRTERATRN
ncbi:hypothetical protein NMG60_11028509 [Bertholletia excelsa]